MPFAPAQEGMSLFQGGTVIALEDASATLSLKGKGEIKVTDNASLKLKEVAGEFSTVTGVRAPVLFLFPTGESGPCTADSVVVTFGINHNLDKIQGVDSFDIYALHEDAEDGVEGDDPEALLDAATHLATFEAKGKVSEKDYTWYSVPSDVLLEEDGEYTLFITATREEETLRLGQSSLLLIENEAE
jgi:hypothetical protein